MNQCTIIEKKKEGKHDEKKRIKHFATICLSALFAIGFMAPIHANAEETAYNEDDVMPLADQLNEMTPFETEKEYGETLEVEGVEYIQTISRTHYEGIEGESDGTDCIEVIDLGLEPVDPAYISNGFQNEGPFYHDFGSNRIRIYVAYTKYTSSNAIDMANYYKISSCSFLWVSIATNNSLANTKINIQNNGMTETAGVIYQSRILDFGTSTAGYLAGYTSWTPTCTQDYIYTGVFVTASFYVNGTYTTYPQWAARILS